MFIDVVLSMIHIVRYIPSQKCYQIRKELCSENVRIYSSFAASSISSENHNLVATSRKHLAVTAGYQIFLQQWLCLFPLLKLYTCQHMPLHTSVSLCNTCFFTHSTNNNHNDEKTHRTVQVVKVYSEGRLSQGTRSFSPNSSSIVGEKLLNFTTVKIPIQMFNYINPQKTLTTRGPLTLFSSTCHFHCGRRSWCGQENNFKNRSHAHGNVKQNSGINPFSGNKFWILRDLLSYIIYLTNLCRKTLDTKPHEYSHNTDTMRYQQIPYIYIHHISNIHKPSSSPSPPTPKIVCSWVDRQSFDLKPKQLSLLWGDDNHLKLWQTPPKAGGVWSCWRLRSLHSLKLTDFRPLKTGHPKRELVFQPSIFRGHVSFREGTLESLGFPTKNHKFLQFGMDTMICPETPSWKFAGLEKNTTDRG